MELVRKVRKRRKTLSRYLHVVFTALICVVSGAVLRDSNMKRYNIIAFEIFLEPLTFRFLNRLTRGSLIRLLSIIFMFFIVLL